MVTVKYKVQSRKFFVNSGNGQFSIMISAKDIKKALGVNNLGPAHELIEPVVAVLYFNSKAITPTQISEEEEFAQEGEDIISWK